MSPIFKLGGIHMKETQTSVKITVEAVITKKDGTVIPLGVIASSPTNSEVKPDG